MKRNARKVILDVLNQVDQGAYVNILMQDIYKLEDLRDLDKNFISKVVYGVLEQRIYLDYVVRHFSSVRLKKIEPSILNILRMGAYQFIFLDKTPDSAVVNESVKLAKKASHRHSGFVNALLRNMMRATEPVALPDLEKTPILHYSVKYAHPEWMVARFIDAFGEAFAVDLMAANNATPALSLRVNTRHGNREDLMTKFQEMGIKSKISDIVEDGILVEDGKQLMLVDNPLFRAGLFTIQDESSMKVTEILGIEAGDLVLDLCAAPGGKCTHIGQKLQGQGKVVACDVSQKKVAIIEENLKRLKIDGIETMVNDATCLNEAFIGAFDKVLLDAPCSGLGIIRRKPDIKYNRLESDALALQAIQVEMIDLASQYLKAGGVLVYSTCTIDAVENEQVIQRFLSDHSEFEIDPVADQPYMKLYPNVDETDGFFCCRMIKK